MPDLNPIFQDIQNCQTPADLWQLMLAYYHRHAVEMVSYHAVDDAGAATTIATDGFPEDWVATYVAQNLVQIDPIPALAARMAQPFYWHEVRDLAPITPDNQRYLTAMKEAGLGDGLGLMVFGPGLQNAYVGLGFGVSRLDLPDTEIFGFQCVAQASHLRYLTIRSQKPPQTMLSPREKEVLTWVARGKSNSVIAQILALSPHTVDSYMRSIYEKLDVSDRTSAAVRGLGHGLLQSPDR